MVERSLNRADYPFASDVVSNVLVYDGARGAQSRRFARSPARNCWPNGSTRLTDGPGIIVIRNAFPDLDRDR